MSVKRKIDKVLSKIDWHIFIPLFSKGRRKKLKTTNFTIISNNCWGGRLYEYFNLPKQSPTVGLYFFSEDYVKFCSNLKHYLSLDLSIVSAEESRHRDELYKKGENDVLIGKLDDVELVFLHYKDKQAILDKWKRRIDRINWDNIILKFSYQNNCSEELIRQFMSIEGYQKICFCGKAIEGCPEVLIYPRSNGPETIDETDNFGRYFNIVKLINERLQ